MNTVVFMNTTSVFMNTQIWFINTNGSINTISVGSMNQFVFIFVVFNKNCVYLTVKPDKYLKK